ncbi:MAG: biotin--[acetyl-CoA-carboxylase] ligase [Alphaproteobacteria bacterium]|nr:MAG: biotin--[acetyl-CoA-carboxylase] ligase [Alphaproteobacteria bacterium]
MMSSLPSGYELKTFDTIDSTNAKARRLVEAGVTKPTWIVSATQTEGRGRQNRRWISHLGNLFCTLLLQPGCAVREAGQLSFVTALAVADVLKQYLPEDRITLKWPNDVLLDEHKVAGILLETCQTEAGRVDALAIGIGINLAHHPQNTDYPSTSIAACNAGKAPQPEAALEDLDRCFAVWYETWRKMGFAPVRNAWLKNAAGLDKVMTAHLPQETLSGRFETLAPGGELILRLPDGETRKIAAADIFFETPRSCKD